MHVEQLTAPYSSENDTWRLSGIGDMHVGNAGFQEKEFLAARKAVLDQGINVILMGDLADCIGVRDKRADLESVDPRYYGSLSRYVDASLDHLKELLEPMRGSVLGVVRGNHEDEVLRATNRDVSYELARHLGVPYLHMSGFLRIRFTRGRFTRKVDVFYHHGAGGAQTKGGKLRKVQRLHEGFDADIYMTGHVHDPLCWKDVSLGLSKGRRASIVQRYRAGLICSSWLATVGEERTLYGERRMYNPVPFCLEYLEISPETGRITKGEV